MMQLFGLCTSGNNTLHETYSVVQTEGVFFTDIPYLRQLRHMPYTQETSSL